MGGTIFAKFSNYTNMKKVRNILGGKTPTNNRSFFGK